MLLKCNVASSVFDSDSFIDICLLCVNPMLICSPGVILSPSCVPLFLPIDAMVLDS